MLLPFSPPTISSRGREDVLMEPEDPQGQSPWSLWGCLALDAFYLLARDVDRSSEPISLDNPAFDHVLDLPTGETEVLGCLHYGELLAVIVLHATNLLARQRPGSRHPIRIPRHSHSLLIFSGALAGTYSQVGGVGIRLQVSAKKTCSLMPSLTSGSLFSQSALGHDIEANITLGPLREPLFRRLSDGVPRRSLVMITSSQDEPHRFGRPLLL